MKFGREDLPDGTELTLPNDHSSNKSVLNKFEVVPFPEVRIGLPKWGKADLENFYPRGTKNQLEYYSTQFNAIEFNAFFYRIFKPEQVIKWRDNTTEGFKFYPKIPQIISQFRRLKDVEHLVDEFLYSISHFNEKLGHCFLQMHPTFSPEHFTTFEKFVNHWPQDVKLAVEFRHTDWYNNEQVSQNLYNLLEERNIANIITDTSGRRDLMHMKLTNSTAFIRFTAANKPNDENRVTEWVNKLSEWHKEGLKEILFFAHVHAEKESPYIPAMFVQKVNSQFGIDLHIPTILKS